MSSTTLHFLGYVIGGVVACLSVLSTAVSAEDLLCYSCFSLNYRSQVAPRNSPLPVLQNPRNLSDLFNVVAELGLSMPPLADGCADVSLTSLPSFISVPRVVCREKPLSCAKLTFLYKGERVVFRECYSPLHFKPHLLPEGLCFDDPRLPSRKIANATLCTCSEALCNGVPSFVHFSFFILVLRFICSL